MKHTTIVNLHCGVAKCHDRLALQIDTDKAQMIAKAGSIDVNLAQISANEALRDAAVYLGWRLHQQFDDGAVVICCPFHAQDLVCRRCRLKDCSCVGGPRWEAVSA